MLGKYLRRPPMVLTYPFFLQSARTLSINFLTPDIYVLCLSTEIANCHAQSYAERQAVNSTVQGSAADLVKKAMLGGLHVF